MTGNFFSFCLKVKWLTFAFLILCFSGAEAGVDFGDPSPINLTAGIIAGLLVGGVIFYICFLSRISAFSRAVRIKAESPKDAFQKHWGKGSIIFSCILSSICALGAAYLAFWLLES
jgi:hypothetical protein